MTTALTQNPSIAAESHFTRYLPVWTPCITDVDEASWDTSLMMKRVCIAFSAGIALFLAAAWTPLLSSVFFIPGVVCILAPLVDGYFTFRAIETNSAARYIQDPHPSRRVRECVAGRVRAAEAFIKRGGDVNKADGCGQRLLDDIQGQKLKYVQYNILRLFLKNGYDLHQTSDKCPKGFLQACAAREDLEVMKFLVKEKFIAPDTLNDDQQFALWCNAGSVETLRLLNGAGFDPNVRNTSGEGVLAHYKDDNDRDSAHLETLAELGAQE